MSGVAGFAVPLAAIMFCSTIGAFVVGPILRDFIEELFGRRRNEI